MDNAALYASSQKLLLGFTGNLRNDDVISTRPMFYSFKIPKRSRLLSKSTTSISAMSQPQGSTPPTITISDELEGLGEQTALVGATPQIAVPTPSSFGVVRVQLASVVVLCALWKVYQWAVSLKLGRQQSSPKRSPSENLKESTEVESQKDSQIENKETNTVISVEALEKMTEDLAVQKIFYPLLPKMMRNPTSFKLMLQNPEYRQELQDMLNSIKGSPEWNKHIMESMIYFDINSPEIKGQFALIGYTPEEVISKVKACPEVYMAWKNPEMQKPGMDCSENSMKIIKYLKYTKFMDVLKKILNLFPVVIDPPWK